MISSLLLQAFATELVELEKEASTAEELRRRRHAYYVENRAKLLQKGQIYRSQNKPLIARKKKRYNRQVKSGTRRQRQRIQTGNFSTGYAGFK